MTSQFKKLLQIGIIVENAEETAKRYETDYGMGPWKFGRVSTDNMPGLTVNGKPEFIDFKVAFCHCFDWKSSWLNRFPRAPIQNG